MRVAALEAFALDALALHFAGAADGFGGFAGAALGGFFVVPAEFHFAEHAFALKFFLERLQRLVDVIVANENLHLGVYSWVMGGGQIGKARLWGRARTFWAYSMEYGLAKHFLAGHVCVHGDPENCKDGAPGAFDAGG